MARAAERPRAEPHPPAIGTAHAFGLRLELCFPVAGLEPGHAPGTRSARVQCVPEADLDGAWPHDEAERMSEHRNARGDVVAAIERHRERGWLLRANGYGRLWLSPGGEHLRCAAGAAPSWRLEHFVVGQGLPLAAVLQGLEAMHAAAVAIDGRAIAISGEAGSGKTSAALALALAGHAELMTDDVLAVETDGDALLAHPGAAAVNVRRSAEELLAIAHDRPVLGEDREGVRMSFPRHARPEPLAAVFLLQRSDAASLEIEPVAADPRVLLGTSFNFLVDTAERRAIQLETYAQIAASAALRAVRVPPGTGPFALAEALAADLARL